MKRPSFQFYPGDWLRDSALLSCSVGARGLWIHMICLMHEGSPYGYLKVGDKVILPANLARMVGATLQETEGWLNELQSAGVFSCAEDGAIFSRRMIRDENIRAARACGGKLGGNPALKDKSKVGAKDNLPPNLPPTPSSSSSSSSANEELGDSATPPPPPPPPKLPKVKEPEKTDEEWRDELACDPTYRHVSIAMEWGKMMRWCEVNRKQPTRRRFINWIGRIERPLGAQQQLIRVAT